MITSLGKLLLPTSNYSAVRNECNQFKVIEDPRLTSLKRGPGGRSSFSGIVATVFGASGFLGRYVCSRLGRMGSQLMIPYRGEWHDVRPLKVAADVGQVLFRPYHLQDDDAIFKAVERSNVVINLVGREWETKNFTFGCVHVDGARRIAKAAKAAGVETLIHISALNACRKPAKFFLPQGSEFLKSKYRGEVAVREEFPEAIIFRPSDIYGPEDRFLRYFCSNWRHQWNWLPLYRKGEKTEKQPIYFKNVVDGIIVAIKDRHNLKGKTIQAVGPKRYLLSELVDWFHRIMDKSHGWSYRRYALESDSLFQARISLLPYMTLGWPFGSLTWEKVERECHSDHVDPDLETLEDLGIELTHMEDQVPWELKIFRAHAYLDLDIKEYTIPAPPQSIPT